MGSKPPFDAAVGVDAVTATGGNTAENALFPMKSNLNGKLGPRRDGSISGKMEFPKQISGNDVLQIASACHFSRSFFFVFLLHDVRRYHSLFVWPPKSKGRTFERNPRIAF